MSDVPVRGQAVHGPIVTASKLTPRVDVVQVMPRPTAVAMASAINDMKISRTGLPSLYR